MKTTTIFSFLCLLLLLNSCVTTKINTSNKQDYSALKENELYIIKTKSTGTIRRFKFMHETNESIIGIYQNKELKITKIDIIKINKFSLGKTVAVVVLPITIIAIVATQLSKSLDWNYNPNGNPNPI
ncbi:hypothetical protein [Flavobacterium sp.]|uniref:hypothetical protein n=1 Tax=Flavobacterium sp. TaxID=239 RepID=UPI004047695E